MMWVKKLKLNDFRNYHQVSLDFSQGINFIQGPNGSGKTSLVEAIGMLALCKSIRTSDEKETIKLDCEANIINAEIENEIKRDLKIVISRKGKYIELDGNEIKRTSKIAGVTKIISFLPKDVDMFKENPTRRRRFIDFNLSMIDQVYLKLLSEYHQYLSEVRNLLKQEKIDLITLEVLLDELLKRSYSLQQKRKSFISLLNENLKKVSEYFDEIKLFLEYHPYITEESYEDYVFNTKELIKKEIINESKSRMIIPGIHLDDISMDFNEMDLSLFGSQGQNRISVILLKLSVFELIKTKFNEEPIIILDDVLSELDETHQQKLLRLLNEIEQVFITGTKLDLKQKVTLFNVENNQVRRVN